MKYALCSSGGGQIEFRGMLEDFLLEFNCLLSNRFQDCLTNLLNKNTVWVQAVLLNCLNYVWYEERNSQIV